jgi:hypothetical protein
MRGDLPCWKEVRLNSDDRASSGPSVIRSPSVLAPACASYSNGKKMRLAPPFNIRLTSDGRLDS